MPHHGILKKHNDVLDVAVGSWLTRLGQNKTNRNQFGRSNAYSNHRSVANGQLRSATSNHLRRPSVIMAEFNLQEEILSLADLSLYQIPNELDVENSSLRELDDALESGFEGDATRSSSSTH